jgi:hypothetical protein
MGDIEHDYSSDGVDRRGFLKCMAWAGTGALWAMQGGVLRSFRSPASRRRGASAASCFSRRSTLVG